MAFVKEAWELLCKIGFARMVNEYEQALFFNLGEAILRKIPEKFLRREMKPERLEQIIAEEKQVLEENGKLKCYMPFVKLQTPKGYKRDFWTGTPLHPERFDKILRTGPYAFIPWFQRVESRDVKEKYVEFPKAVTVLTTDDEPKNITLGCIVRYELLNLYKAYTQVENWENSLRECTRGILSVKGRGKTLKYWSNPEDIAKLEKEVKDEIREIATERWGMRIIDFIITTDGYSSLQRIMHEGITKEDSVAVAYTPTPQE